MQITFKSGRKGVNNEHSFKYANTHGYFMGWRTKNGINIVS